MTAKDPSRYTYLMALGHFGSDINQGALAAVLPFLIAAYQYDYATAATLVLVANLVGSVVQPLFGQLADQGNRPWLIALGLALAGGGMAVTGLIPNFYGLCAAVMVSGTGIAMFHPQAAQLVNRCAGEGEKGKSISIFSFGGNLGFTFGPILVTAAVGWFGLPGTLLFLVPEVLICFLLKVYDRDLYDLNRAPGAAAAAKETAGTDRWGAFGKLTAVVFGRSILFYGFNTFLALYWINVLGQSVAAGGTILSVYYAIGALSTLAGGKLADRYGCRRMIRASFAVFLPAAILLALTTNVWLAALLILPLGASIGMAYSPIVVLGQQYLPNRIGLASGVTLGLAVSVGGIFAPILGAVADRFGLVEAMYLLTLIAIMPLVMSFFLPPTEQEEAVG